MMVAFNSGNEKQKSNHGSHRKYRMKKEKPQPPNVYSNSVSTIICIITVPED
jgi:hypothetical protein